MRPPASQHPTCSLKQCFELNQFAEGSSFPEFSVRTRLAWLLFKELYQQHEASICPVLPSGHRQLSALALAQRGTAPRSAAVGRTRCSSSLAAHLLAPAQLSSGGEREQRRCWACRPLQRCARRWVWALHWAHTPSLRGRCLLPKAWLVPSCTAR